MALVVLALGVTWWIRTFRTYTPVEVAQDLQAAVAARNAPKPVERFLELRYGPLTQPENRQKAFLDFFNVGHIEGLQILVSRAPESRRKASIDAMAEDTRRWAFQQPADEKNPYAYAHTGEDLLRLPGRLEQLAAQQHLAHPRIAVVAADAWPLPWYLRKFSQVGFWQPGQDTGPADFFITSTDVSDALAEQLKDYRQEFFGWRPNVLLLLWSPVLTNTAPANSQP